MGELEASQTELQTWVAELKTKSSVSSDAPALEPAAAAEATPPMEVTSELPEEPAAAVPVPVEAAPAPTPTPAVAAADDAPTPAAMEEKSVEEKPEEMKVVAEEPMETEAADPI